MVQKNLFQEVSICLFSNLTQFAYIKVNPQLLIWCLWGNQRKVVVAPQALMKGQSVHFQSFIRNYHLAATFFTDVIIWKSKQTYPKNLVPGGPISMILLANASPSFRSGGWSNFSFLIMRHVILVGMEAFPGGITILTPEWRVPRIAPPRASTMKLTRKLRSTIVILLVFYPM